MSETNDENLVVEIVSQEYVESFPIDDMVEHPENPNKGDLDLIMDSLETNEFYGYCVVQKSTNHILVGNHRSRVARTLGNETVPVLVVDCDDETATRIMLADNQTAKRGRQNEEKLLRGLQFIEAESGSLVGTGYSLSEMEEVASSVSDFGVQLEETDGFGGDDEKKSSLSVANVVVRIGEIAFKVSFEEASGSTDRIKKEYGTSRSDVRRGVIERLGFNLSDVMES